MMDLQVSPTERQGRDLIDATRPFASEDIARTRYYVATTFLALAAMTAVAASPLPLPLRALASIIEGLIIVRGFILYHDVLHNAIARGPRLEAKLLRAFFAVYGVLVLTPPNVWRQTHNYHHAHNAKIVGSHVGSYIMLTTEMWRRIGPRDRFMYKLSRHPLTILFAYGTVFLYGMCVSSFARNPRKNWDSALAVVVHAALLAAVIKFAGLATCLLAVVLPLAVAFMAGAYLFYIQHNFEGMHVQPREDWTFTRAALESSSFFKSGPVLRWFTGNIGFHHVHHLNATIPFYRLPEAMAAIPELQHPVTFTLTPANIATSFKLKLWDPEQNRMVGYP